ncbi:MAG: hypothetical protein ACOYBY_17730 [Dermatophilaceae bacterium]
MNELELAHELNEVLGTQTLAGIILADAWPATAKLLDWPPAQRFTVMRGIARNMLGIPEPEPLMLCVECGEQADGYQQARINNERVVRIEQCNECMGLVSR